MSRRSTKRAPSMFSAMPLATHLVRVGGFVALLVGAAGCVTVKPQQRGVLSDPIMRFGGNGHDAVEQAHFRHAIDNREGSFGGEGVAGGGCGCN